MNIFARGTILLGLSSLLLFCFGKFAIADEFHYNNLLIGDRASGMGGAYTAVSDDATGMYYNPAGIVYVGDKNFSASVNAYYTQIKKYNNVIGGQPFERKSSALLANYFGIVKPIGKFKIGFSYAVPDAVSEDQNQTFTNVSASVTRLTMNLNNKDNTINFGPSLAAEINHDLAVGLTLYAHKRDVQVIQNQFVERTDTTTQWSNSYFKLSEAGVKPILGVAWSPADKLSLGLSLSKTLVLSSDSIKQDTCWDSSSTPGCPIGTPVVSVKLPRPVSDNVKRQYPIRAAIGAAYFADKNFLLSSDLTYYTAVQDATYGDKAAVINAALGTEYYLSKKWAVRAGLYTNMANTLDIQAGITDIEEQINLYGGSLSISNFSGSSSVTLGGSVNYGKGKSQIISGKGVQDASTFGWLIFLSSSY
ncbi:MAG: outer membrane protein transport protein [Gallionellaceae bacterium]|nr:outer membrane protein transport protein [Gallionellaceae bacterium]